MAPQNDDSQSREALREALRERCAHNQYHNRPQVEIKSCHYCDETFNAILLALQALREEDYKALEAVAQEVGGKFWKTHQLNTGLLIAIERLRSSPLVSESLLNQLKKGTVRESMRTWASKFRQFRRTKHFTQAMLCEALGISRRCLGYLESGTHQPRYTTILKFEALIARHKNERNYWRDARKDLQDAGESSESSLGGR